MIYACTALVILLALQAFKYQDEMFYGVALRGAKCSRSSDVFVQSERPYANRS
jgi:hypothetical protein